MAASRIRPNSLLPSAVAAALVVFGIGVAHADSNDDDFVQKVNNSGVAGAPDDLIRVAHQVCEGLDGGNTPDAIRDALASQLGLRPDRAAIFVAFSASHYCPKYGNLQFKTGS
ncbi:hypothetical protein BN000_05575 [Mycobacterium europaeum]|uniref:DUF732 domain-containing protein n=1 Tax=Mycobacterium europaeum TaxID=761804 RepID=A0A0U1DV19_9MYCO|nr:DUF732 domain-containing protein [Mycobacterium europaeum]CQD22343.1 hypothetical protein BN000_05575 [Mycobacterium europaeum]